MTTRGSQGSVTVRGCQDFELACGGRAFEGLMHGTRTRWFPTVSGTLVVKNVPELSDALFA